MQFFAIFAFYNCQVLHFTIANTHRFYIWFILTDDDWYMTDIYDSWTNSPIWDSRISSEQYPHGLPSDNNLQNSFYSVSIQPFESKGLIINQCIGFCNIFILFQYTNTPYPALAAITLLAFILQWPKLVRPPKVLVPTAKKELKGLFTNFLPIVQISYFG